MIITLFSISALCFIAVIYPYFIYPVILALMAPTAIRRDAVGAGDGSRFSLLFCAYNEADAMPSKLTNIKAIKDRYPALEVLAFDDGSTDGTADLIATGAPFIRLIRGGGRNGKAHGMKLLAALANGELLIFTDANVLLDTSAPDALAACYADPEVGGVCGALHYLGKDGTATAAIGGMYWRLEEKIKDLESRSGSVMGADGSIFSIRADLYPEFPDTVLDDFTVSMEVVFKERRLIKSNDVIAFEQLVSSRADEFYRKIRIAARAFHTHRTLEKITQLTISPEPLPILFTQNFALVRRRLPYCRNGLWNDRHNNDMAGARNYLFGNCNADLLGGLPCHQRNLVRTGRDRPGDACHTGWRNPRHARKNVLRLESGQIKVKRQASGLAAHSAITS